MGIRKILERLRGSPEPPSPEHSREPISFEQTQVSFERARAEFEAAHREMREIQRQDEEAGRGITNKWIAASQHVDALRHRLRQAKEDFAKAGGSPDRVELTELVTRKVKQCFAGDEQAEAIRLLETECARSLPFCESYNAEDLEVVRLAVVKLAGGSLEGLRQQIEAAQTDWRDVIFFAQAPEEVNRGYYTDSNEADAETREMKARDRQQYEKWLRGDGSSDPPAA
jgi:hypothetical protein